MTLHALTHSRRIRAVLAAIAASVLAATSATAGGMALTMQNGAHLAHTYSGGASAEDASTTFYNPAGLTYLTQAETVLGGCYVIFDTGFTNRGSNTAGILATSGTNADDGGADSLVPSLYVAMPLPRGLTFGLGVSAPFGLGTEYANGWVGRYHALKSELRVINVNPALAWRMNEQLSIGFGFNWQSAEAELSNAIDVGLIGYANGISGFAPGSADAILRIKGDDTTNGFNLGALYSPADGTRIGVHFRSKMAHTLKGRAEFSGVAAPFAPLFSNQDVTAPLTLPEVVSLSFYHDLSPQLTVLADWSWWKWSRFRELAVDFASPATPDSVQPQNWGDSSIYSVGVRWIHDEKLTLRAGAAYNETPVPSAEMRTARIPDSDRIWLGVGASWQLNAETRVELGLAHLFMQDSTINNNDGLGHVLRGDVNSSVTIISTQFRWRF